MVIMVAAEWDTCGDNDGSGVGFATGLELGTHGLPSCPAVLEIWV